MLWKTSIQETLLNHVITVFSVKWLKMQNGIGKVQNFEFCKCPVHH